VSAGGNEGIPHGSPAIVEGLTRTLEIDHAAMAASFRTVLADIRSGGFARRSRTRNGTAIRCWRVRESHFVVLKSEKTMNVVP
jgi:hypothetical protein